MHKKCQILLLFFLFALVLLELVAFDFVEGRHKSDDSGSSSSSSSSSEEEGHRRHKKHHRRGRNGDEYFGKEFQETGFYRSPMVMQQQPVPPQVVVIETGRERDREGRWKDEKEEGFLKRNHGVAKNTAIVGGALLGGIGEYAREKSAHPDRDVSKLKVAGAGIGGGLLGGIGEKLAEKIEEKVVENRQEKKKKHRYED